MYLRHVNALLMKAIRETFDADHPLADLRDLHISQEFAVDRADYPAIWVQWDPIGMLENVGVGHYEEMVDNQGAKHRVMRWSFAGEASFTVSALTSQERDHLADELIKVIAFGEMGGPRGTMRRIIEQDTLARLTMNWGQISQSGRGASQGTPWGSDEVLYEFTMSIAGVGEFLSDPDIAVLLPVSSVGIIVWNNDLETDPTIGDNGGQWLS